MPFDFNVAQDLKSANENSNQTELAFSRISPEDADKIAEFLKTNQTIEKLSLTHIEINHEEVSLKTANEITIKIAEALIINTKLKTLVLSINFGNRGAVALAEALSQNKTLTKLCLQGNSIGDRGAIALAESLEKNNTLILLDLSLNRIKQQGINSLLNALTNNVSLKEIDITLNKAPTEIVKDTENNLIEIVKNNKALERIE